MRTRPRHGRGFTLVELMITVTIAGIVFASVALFIQRPVQGYLDANRRSALSDTADAALRRILRDLRLALPNSVRVDASGRYLEFLQVSGGGRYRAATDSAGAGDPLDFEDPAGDSSFDVIGTPPAVTSSQFVVVFNLGTGFTGADAYQVSSNNRAAISGAAGNRITLAAAKAFPHASPGKRFHVVDYAVTYECDPVEGVIRRYWNYGIAATQATPPTGGSNALLATRVTDCAFTYNANELLQRYGTVSLRVAIGAQGETLTLHGQAHVSNVP